MRLVITGGGTGGHIYPALEVARLCAEHGHGLRYLGSLRGQEAKLCASRGIPFEGFASEPVYSLRTPRGWLALARLFRASSEAAATLRRDRPDIVFSTGGYAAAPVVRAARSLGIPYVIHEQNSIPGRSNLLFARQAKAVATTFRISAQHFPGCRLERTGMPVRASLRTAAAHAKPGASPSILVVGGSQGSLFLNETLPSAAKRLKRGDVTWLHSTGPAHDDAMVSRLEGLGLVDQYRAVPYFDETAMAEAYGRAWVVVARSGGTLAELAVFRLPSVLVPLPSAAANHQYHNAKEFADMGAATNLSQSDATAETIAAALSEWLDNPSKRAAAAATLAEWDVPDATHRIVALIEGAAT